MTAITTAVRLPRANIRQYFAAGTFVLLGLIEIALFRQRHCLAGLLREFLQVRPGQGPDVEPLTRGRSQPHDPDAEAVAPCRRQVLHQPAARDRCENPGDTAPVDPRAPRDLLGA